MKKISFRRDSHESIDSLLVYYGPHLKIRAERLGLWVFGTKRYRTVGLNFEFHWGPGAGYVGGWTFFAAWNGRDKKHYRYHHRLPFQIGFTTNANIVPSL